MTHKLNDLIPMLICEDTQESIRFYTEVLGFRVTDRMDDVGRSGWASVRHGSIDIMLASPHVYPESAKVNGRFPQLIFYFYPDDVVALQKSIREKGYSTTDLVVRFYGMKEFELVDPSGHVLVFGQETNEPPTPCAEE